MRPAVVPGVVGFLTGRRGQKRALGRSVSGARASARRERASVDCEAVAYVGACYRGWCACLGAAAWLHSPHDGCQELPGGGRGDAAGPRRRPGGPRQGQSLAAWLWACCSWPRAERPSPIVHLVQRLPDHLAGHVVFALHALPLQPRLWLEHFPCRSAVAAIPCCRMAGPPSIGVDGTFANVHFWMLSASSDGIAGVWL